MSSMTESVQAAISALRHLQPADRDSARAALGNWVPRSGKLSDIEVDRVLNYYFTGSTTDAVRRIAEPMEPGCTFRAGDVCELHGGVHTEPRTIEVADGHVVHTCCGKLDDAPHKNFCEHYTAEPVSAQHPRWCHLESCTFVDGGVHRSRPRTVPGPQSLDQRPLTVELVEARTGGPRVRVRRAGDPWSAQVTLDGARLLARALRDLAIAAGALP